MRSCYVIALCILLSQSNKVLTAPVAYDNSSSDQSNNTSHRTPVNHYFPGSGYNPDLFRDNQNQQQNKVKNNRAYSSSEQDTTTFPAK